MATEEKTPAEWCEYAIRLANESEESMPIDKKSMHIACIIGAMHALLSHMLIQIEDAEHTISGTSVDQQEIIFQYQGAIEEKLNSPEANPRQKIDYYRTLLRYIVRIFEKPPVSLACDENSELQEIIDTPLEINLP